MIERLSEDGRLFAILQADAHPIIILAGAFADADPTFDVGGNSGLGSRRKRHPSRLDGYPIDFALQRHIRINLPINRFSLAADNLHYRISG